MCNIFHLVCLPPVCNPHCLGLRGRRPCRALEAAEGNSMGNKACPLRLTLAAITLAFLGAANHADAQTFSVLYNLASNSGPYGGVVFDSAGNLYGTTSGGGTYSGGTVYELSPQ